MQELRIIITSICVFFLFLVCFIMYLINSKAKKYDKKFSSFALSTKDESQSILDGVNSILWNLIHFISRFFEKSKLLRFCSAPFDKYISYSDGKKIKAIDIVTIKLCCFLLSFLTFLLLSLTKVIEINYSLILFFSLLFYFIPNLVLRIKYISKRKAINQDIVSAIIIINSALKNGASIRNAIELVSVELDGSIGDEFKKMAMDIRYGLSVLDAFKRFDERVGIESTYLITHILSMVDEVGNSIIPVFSYIEEVLLKRQSLENELESTTAGARFLYKLCFIFPFFFTIGLLLWHKDKIAILFPSVLGVILFIVLLFFYILYITLMKLITKVDET